MHLPRLNTRRTGSAPWFPRHGLLLLAAALTVTSCSDGSDGKDGKDGAPGDGVGVNTDLDPGEDPPGIVVEIQKLSGASGPGDRFQVGDKVAVHFTVTMQDGTPWPIDELSQGRTLVSGPTFNYQRVIAERSDVIDLAVKQSDGSYKLTNPTPIPATYLAPLNDTPSFGADDGELTGMPLLGGTYSVGLYFRWDYEVEGEGYSDQGDTVHDFLLGGAGPLEPRALVSLDHCNQCHVDLEAHGGNRKEVRLCVLCHTAGAEDRNTGGATPGVTIEFGTMIHKIHAGAHLPSVLGVATNPDGSRNYAATPVPYELVGFGNSVHDFSDVHFPWWPNASVPLPRDEGYSGLTADERALEDAIRTGPAACFVCHGDPDGSGPIEAPEQGDLIYSQPTRNNCGACHDDVDWDHPYTSNGQTMPAQNDDAACKLCHDPMGGSLAVFDAHRHPLFDPAFNPGLVFELTGVAEGGLDDGDDTIDPGEKIAATFFIWPFAGFMQRTWPS